ncbi:carbonic anhydrase, partial [Streptomyces scabiei]|nr:carbonic anhydrase [Streptomyces scabiei]
MTFFVLSHRGPPAAVTSTVMVMTTSAAIPTGPEGAISDGTVTDRLVEANQRYAAAFT